MAVLLGRSLADAGATAGLYMLPLYKRCKRCRRFATYGAPGPVRREVTRWEREGREGHREGRDASTAK